MKEEYNKIVLDYLSEKIIFNNIYGFLGGKGFKVVFESMSIEEKMFLLCSISSGDNDNFWKKLGYDTSSKEYHDIIQHECDIINISGRSNLWDHINALIEYYDSMNLIGRSNQSTIKEYQLKYDLLFDRREIFFLNRHLSIHKSKTEENHNIQPTPMCIIDFYGFISDHIHHNILRYTIKNHCSENAIAATNQEIPTIIDDIEEGNIEEALNGIVQEFELALKEVEDWCAENDGMKSAQDEFTAYTGQGFYDVGDLDQDLFTAINAVKTIN